jgi:hypothetical protein
MATLLYRYFPLGNPKNVSRVADYFKGRVYFSSPTYFNDPFELSSTVLPPTYEVFIKALEKDPNFHTFSKSQLSKEYKKLKEDFMRKPEQAFSKDWVANIGILCLTESFMNHLMWAHYADSHRGICIGLEKQKAPFNNAMQVEYSTERPEIEYPLHRIFTDKDLEQLLLTKSIEWSYEKEWRIIKRQIKPEEIEFYKSEILKNPDSIDEIADIVVDSNGCGTYDFDSDAIKVIYLGVNISENDSDAIIKLAKASKHSIKVFKMILDKKYYILHKHKVL